MICEPSSRPVAKWMFDGDRIDGSLGRVLVFSRCNVERVIAADPAGNKFLVVGAEYEMKLEDSP
jgi:hypothetical protein